MEGYQYKDSETNQADLNRVNKKWGWGIRAFN